MFLGQPVICPNCGSEYIASATSFDPYYTWLGIPPAEQPPNRYRLLGLQLFEPNLDVIENAADRQMMHVRSYQLGAHALDSQRLLNEIASARIALLEPHRKEAYDEQLRQTLAPALPVPHYEAVSPPHLAVTAARHGAPGQATAIPLPPEAPPAPLLQPVGQLETLLDSGVRRRSHARQRTPPSTILTPFMIIAGAIVGLGLGALIVFYITGQDYLGWSANLRKKFDSSKESAPSAAPAQQRPQTSGSHGATQTQPMDSRRDAIGSKPPTTLLQEAVPAQAPAPTLISPSPPVASFPTAVSLPDPALREPAVLTQIPVDAADPMKFDLHAGLAALPTKARLLGETNAETGAFLISFEPASDSDMPKLPLASFRRDGGNLMFQWTDSPVDRTVRRQLRNCFLDIIIGGESRMIQLREPLAASKLELDLEDDKQDFGIELEDLPKLARLRLTGLNLRNFPAGKIRGGGTICEFGKSLFVDFENQKGPQIELRFLHQPRTKALIVHLESSFRESANRKFELSLRGLEKVQRAQEKLLSEAQAGRSQAQTLLTNANSTLRQLQANPPAPSQKAAWDAQVAAASSVIAAAPRTFERLDAQIAEAQARLAAVPEVQGFISSLHKKAFIDYSISAIDGDRELVLVRKTSAE